MIGSVIGVGVANQLMNGHNGVSGVDWNQVTKVFKALLVSPLVGFIMAALLFFLFKLLLATPVSTRLPKAPRLHRSTSAACSSSPAAASATSTALTTAKKAWASSCSSSSAPSPPPTPSTTPSTPRP